MHIVLFLFCVVCLILSAAMCMFLYGVVLLFSLEWKGQNQICHYSTNGHWKILSFIGLRLGSISFQWLTFSLRDSFVWVCSVVLQLEMLLFYSIQPIWTLMPKHPHTTTNLKCWTKALEQSRARKHWYLFARFLTAIAKV